MTDNSYKSYFGRTGAFFQFGVLGVVSVLGFVAAVGGICSPVARLGYVLQRKEKNNIKTNKNKVLHLNFIVQGDLKHHLPRKPGAPSGRRISPRGEGVLTGDSGSESAPRSAPCPAAASPARWPEPFSLWRQKKTHNMSFDGLLERQSEKERESVVFSPVIC